MKFLTMVMITLLAAGTGYLSFLLIKRRGKYINGLNKFSRENKHFDAVVTSVAQGHIMLKFRDEGQKKTIHHKYVFARNQYKTDAVVTVFYDEKSDSVCVEGDNPFVYKARWCVVGSVVCIVVAMVLITVGIVNMI